MLTQQRIGTWWQHWEDKVGEEKNWPPYLTSRRLMKVSSLTVTPQRAKVYGTTLIFISRQQLNCELMKYFTKFSDLIG